MIKQTIALADNKTEFSRITLEDKKLYDSYLAQETERGCEFSFANLYLWGRQSMAISDGYILLFSQFDRRSVYPFPLGKGNIKPVIDRIISDAHARGIPCRITGIGVPERMTLEELYPGKFRFHTDEGDFDYVYSINDLADLKGKKYHSKRNHLNRFTETYPNYTAEPLSEANMQKVKEMIDKWYEKRLAENPNGDYHMERAALNKVLRDCKELELESIVIRNGDDILAFSAASRLSDDTFDIHFEKALPEIQGAYTVVNMEMARYIRNKYPDVLYLDREEDMGLDGLRKAKKSYYPHHMIEKCWACLLEDGYDY